MSGIRLYLLDVLSERGPMYGHQLKLLAERETIQEWRHISAGALYGALKRMCAEGLIDQLRSEREGAYPERQVYGITDAGRIALDETKRDAMLEIAVHSDPFDLAMSRLSSNKLDSLNELLNTRIAHLRKLAAEADAEVDSSRQSLDAPERIVFRHKAARLEAELRWHEELYENLPEIIARESARKGT